jgi:1,4-alpha-glucan branching enzyme
MLKVGEIFVSPRDRQCTFRLDGVRAASVALIGDFNAWSTTANLMQRRDGRWEVEITLPPGRHAYGFFALEHDNSLRGTVLGIGSAIDVPRSDLPRVSNGSREIAGFRA